MHRSGNIRLIAVDQLDARGYTLPSASRLPLCLANCCSGGYGQLIKPTDMRFPSELVEISTVENSFAADF